MTQVAGRSHDRIARRQVDKFADRRAQLAASTLQTLSDLGYARTSLREIAQNSEFSHGVLHYYFRDKVDLITYSVRQYKAECVTRYDEIVETASSTDELRLGFGAAMADTLLHEGPLHKLWYDLRNQSLFEESFRDDVVEIDQNLERMIWNVVSRYAELAGTPCTVSPATAYAIFDGVFQRALFKHVAGDPAAPGDLRSNVEQLLERFVAA
ncbi:TetR/AcrR family transcriptional regulator [Amycolatopsis palatopharyngis]|uniref:TetR/AcrR family transcriptional regulator n=1 Tax=Amycolatopsis palatopharyngis TaxID=187982 RepID=UPI000E25360B|nr:TetR/AcrR family transcriptional regulator [Amycolatopsis palatopharyngis]